MATRIIFDAPVAEVTLLEDRAHVLRRGTVELQAGRNILVVERVAPVLADKTLAAAFLGGGAAGATIDDLRVRRHWLPRSERSGELHELNEQLRTLSHERNRLAEDFSRASHRLDQHKHLIHLTASEMAEDIQWDRAPQSEWRAQYDAMQAHARTATDALLEQQFALHDLDEQIQAVHASIAQAQGDDPARTATVEIDVTPAAAGAHELRVEYVVPGACWRPYHVARLTEPADAPAALHWESQGCAWQATGEDWTDVTLRFSTQRLSLGAEPPRLGTDTLHVKKKAEQLEVEAREETIQTTGLGRDKNVVPELPGVDDGGQTLTLTAPAKATIPSDGRPYRVPLFEFDSAATATLLAAPELALAALWKSTQTNGASHAILAGPVDLVRKFGLVGRTTVLFVAPGEQFEMGWGPDAEIRLRREQHQVHHERGMLSSWDGKEQRIAIRLSNLAPEPKTLELKERVPVSEVEKVKVEPDAEHTTEGKTPDADGFVTWSVTLPPFGTTHVKLRYTLKIHKDVVGL
ncbi:MAG: mucoidy inhibitor MuiA family protein [Planctomycetota bacterium]|jgi:uncharacterized protein (TIGR02231 family)